MVEEVKRERVAGYVSPESAKIIEEVKDKLSNMISSRVSIGMALDYIISEYSHHEEQ